MTLDPIRTIHQLQHTSSIILVAKLPAQGAEKIDQIICLQMGRLHKIRLQGTSNVSTRLCPIIDASQAIHFAKPGMVTQCFWFYLFSAAVLMKHWNPFICGISQLSLHVAAAANAAAMLPDV